MTKQQATEYIEKLTQIGDELLVYLDSDLYGDGTQIISYVVGCIRKEQDDLYYVNNDRPSQRYVSKKIAISRLMKISIERRFVVNQIQSK